MTFIAGVPPSASATPASLEERRKRIEKLLLCDKIDLHALKRISREPGGFIDNKLRSRVWPKLLGINRFVIPDYRKFICRHRDDPQIRCDVERSLWSLDENKDWIEPLRDKRRKVLSDVMIAVLCRNRSLYYYQGFHDVCSVFLLVMEDDHLAFAMSEVVSDRYLRDFMAKDFEVLSKTMRLIMTLINACDPKLYAFLSAANVEPYFATSWLITWWAHDVKSLDEIGRVFDAMLCSHPLFALYLCVAMVANLRTEIMQSECDFASLFNFLVHAPAVHGFDFERLLAIADRLMQAFPPSRLRYMVTDVDLKGLITRNAIESFTIPIHLKPQYVPADWVLLMNMRLSPRAQLQRYRMPPVTARLSSSSCSRARVGWWLSFRFSRRPDIDYVSFTDAPSGSKDSTGLIEDDAEEWEEEDDADDESRNWFHPIISTLWDIDQRIHKMRNLLVGASVGGLLLVSIGLYLFSRDENCGSNYMMFYS